MKARVCDFKYGFREYDDVGLIRVKSPQVNLLIMEDHMPMIGNFTGTVEILGKDVDAVFRDIEGYYMHKKNVFELIIKD